MFAILFAFVASAIAGYMAGLLGSSNNPISGVTVSVLLITSLILLGCGLSGNIGAFPADLIGAQFGGEPASLAMREHALFAHRLRLGGKRLTPGGHSHYHIFTRFWDDERYPKYFERRQPELFAQGYKPVPHMQLCWTSQDVVDQTVLDIQDYFKLPDHSKPQNAQINQANVGDEYYGLGAMDTDEWCQCPRCNAIIRKNVPPGSARYDKDSISDYWFQFVNRVAQGMQKTNPDKKLISLAYGLYSHRPTFKLEPNVAIVQVFGTRCVWERAANAGMTELIDEWVRESGGTRPRYLWLHYLFPVPRRPLQSNYNRLHRRL